MDENPTAVKIELTGDDVREKYKVTLVRVEGASQLYFTDNLEVDV